MDPENKLKKEFEKVDWEEIKELKMRTNVERLPKYLLDKIKTVLSKYKRVDVYEKGVDYMHLYSLIH